MLRRSEAASASRGALRPLCSAGLFLSLTVGLSGALLGCTASSDEVRPPADQFFFPTGLALDQGQDTLFVTSANSELRYDSGAVNAVDLGMVDMVVEAWTGPDKTIPAGCEQDPALPETLVCDEAAFITSSVRIGNFATNLSVQDLGGGNARLIVPVRGDPSITWIEWDGSKLSCEDGSSSGFIQCDDRHRLTLLRNDEELGNIPEEPFRSFADAGGEFALVTHLSSGTVTLLDSRAGQDPVVADAIGGLFLPSTTSLPGGTAVAGRTPTQVGTPSDSLIYVGGRTEDRIQTLTVERPTDGLPYLVQSNYFFLDAAGGNSGGSSDTRGLAFGSGGDRMLVANRRPPTLQIYDTSLDASGFPKHETVAVYDICREASGLAVSRLSETDPAEYAFVPCFRDGTMYILDADGRRPTTAVLTVGRGPFEVTVSPRHQKAYVTNFLEDSIGVVELKPGSDRQFREVLRIGKTRL